MLARRPIGNTINVFETHVHLIANGHYGIPRYIARPNATIHNIASGFYFVLIWSNLSFSNFSSVLTLNSPITTYFIKAPSPSAARFAPVSGPSQTTYQMGEEREEERRKKK